MNYKFSINNDQITALQDIAMHSGNLNSYIFEFEFNKIWNELLKFGVFKILNVDEDTETKVIVPVFNNKLTVPQEILKTPNEVIFGLYGTNAKENIKRISTEMISLTVTLGAYQDNSPSPPTPDVWESLIYKCMPKIIDDYWYIYNIETQCYENSGLSIYNTNDDIAMTSLILYNEPNIQPSPENWFTVNDDGDTIVDFNSEFDHEIKQCDTLVFPYSINGKIIKTLDLTKYDDYHSPSTRFEVSNATKIIFPNTYNIVLGSQFYAPECKTVNIPVSSRSFIRCVDWINLETVITTTRLDPDITYPKRCFRNSNIKNADNLMNGVKTLSEACFSGSNVNSLIIPESVCYISSGSLSDMVLECVTFLNPNCTINQNVFVFDGNGTEYFPQIIKGYKNSTAERLANSKNIPFIAINEDYSQKICTTLPNNSILDTDTIYSLEEVSSQMVLSLPNANIGNYIELNFISGDIPHNIDITSNCVILGYDNFTVEANKVYSIYFDWGIVGFNSSNNIEYGWRFNYVSYDLAVNEDV